MTDIEKIRTEIEKAYNEAQNRVKLVKDEYWEGKVDSYRNVLCIFDSMQEEPVNKNYRERYKRIAQSEEFKKTYEGMSVGEIMHVEGEESVSENLEEAANFYADTHTEWFDADNNPHVSPAFKAGAQWQKEKMMAKAIDAQCFGFQDAALFSFRLPVGNYLVGSEVKVIVIKED